MKTKIGKMCIAIVLLILIIIILLKFVDIETIILKKTFPLKYEEYVNQYSKEFEVDSMLVFAIIKAESNFDAKSVSDSNAKGTMQLMEATGKETAEKLEVEYKENETLFDVEKNIMLGTKYFSDLLKKYDDNYVLALIAYNAGIGNVQKWVDEGILNADGSNIEDIPFQETEMYVRKIIRNYKLYKQLYSEGEKNELSSIY